MLSKQEKEIKAIKQFNRDKFKRDVQKKWNKDIEDYQKEKKKLEKELALKNRNECPKHRQERIDKERKRKLKLEEIIDIEI